MLSLVFSMTGELGKLPAPQELADAGIQSFGSDEHSGSMGITATLQGAGELKTPTASQQLVSVGMGLPSLPRKMVDRIRANEYVDFAELPPARGKGRPMSQAMEGQVIVVQAADLLQSRRVIPDLATWSQCFALYVAVLAPHQPARLLELMSYQSLIAKASAKFRWPSWVVYDQNFRQEAAGNSHMSWAKADPSIYAQCFTNQALSGENWCDKCHSLDHPSSKCPSRPRKRPWSAVAPHYQLSGGEDVICKKYNRFNGDCKFGKECRFQHVCLKCREPHPVSKCRVSGAGLAGSAGSSSGAGKPFTP